ncbi:hypothetical protein BK133_01390 [Paenibacillus sp. FSL H8-0548]|uniref:hypothetical protein n=1 Tax=Paenibacillus sp. FSL H8-0548 TaxID=1920422 RepID=UPI00096DDF9A|nr:hypothetical protein [Paenibacillus sp. FSL H8-0548]OMF38880.1 hypothetical protein BK133_01390 [Paenibacillus sp. FSL H8-0548]
MSSYIRSIRGIERTNAYVPVQAANRYTYYPYHDGEIQQFFGNKNEWNRSFQQAAGSASAWLRTSNEAQSNIVQLTAKLSSELHNHKPITDSLSTLTRLLNQWESSYKQHAEHLKPELWASIELALRHPASHHIHLRRSMSDGLWVTGSGIESSQEDSSASRLQSPATAERLKRVLLGADGLLNVLKHAFTYGDQHKAIDLLQPQLTSTLPYAAYLGSIQSYSPVPYAGWIVNRYL